MTDELRLPAGAAHVFVRSVDDPDLLDADAHHLTRVLRLRDGEIVTVADGLGAWRSCRMVRGALESDSPVAVVAPPQPRVTVAFAITKGDRPEWTVQKLTELGVDRIVPVAAEHGVVRWDDARAARNIERLRGVARAAAMQARRVFLPVLDDVLPSVRLSSVTIADSDGFALAHPGGDPPSLAWPAIAVGPEGGWSASEVEGFPRRVDLGPTTLRSETAAIAAAALLVGLRAGLVAESAGNNT